MASRTVPPKEDEVRPSRAGRFSRGLGSRQARFGVLASLLTLGAAVGLALLTGSRIGPITGGVESASFASAAAIRSLSGALPLGYAVGAGMVAAVNPCGFAMLPSYLGLYLGAGDGSHTTEHLSGRIIRAVRISGTLSGSFMLLFGTAGVVLSLASSAVAHYFPWAGLAVGVLLVLVAGRMLAGGTLYSSIGERMADRMQDSVRRPGLRGYFAYGLAYGLASLSCTLPIFLAVVSSALVVNGLLAGVVQVLPYAPRIGLGISRLTLGGALFKHAPLGGARRGVALFPPPS